MRCKHISKQTRGKINEVELEGLRCSMAESCRRKSICALSAFSIPELVREQYDPGHCQEGSVQGRSNSGSDCFEILKFKNSLGFQWVRVGNYTEAVKALEDVREKDSPRLIRRIEIIELAE